MLSSNLYLFFQSLLVTNRELCPQLKLIYHMTKAIEGIVIVTLLLFAFFIGVKYSESVKSHASWLFENKDDEVELPDLSNENSGEIGTTVDENATTPEAAPMDSLDEAAAPATAPTQAPAAAAPIKAPVK